MNNAITYTFVFADEAMKNFAADELSDRVQELAVQLEKELGISVHAKHN